LGKDQVPGWDRLINKLDTYNQLELNGELEEVIPEVYLENISRYSRGFF